MNSLPNLRVFVKEQIAKYPELEENIKGLYHLCLAEIAEGESVQNEIDHCIFAIEEIIEEFLEENNNN